MLKLHRSQCLGFFFKIWMECCIPFYTSLVSEYLFPNRSWYKMSFISQSIVYSCVCESVHMCLYVTIYELPFFWVVFLCVFEIMYMIMCVSVSVWIYIALCMCVHVWMCMHVCMCVCSRTWMYVLWLITGFGFDQHVFIRKWT